jgi:hypothetical protein
MAPSLRSLALLSTDALLTHAVYAFIAGVAASLYASVATTTPLVVSVVVTVAFMGFYYAVYRLVGRVSVPRPPNEIEEPDGTAPFKIPFLSNTGDNEDFESTKRWSRYTTGSDAGSVFAIPIAGALFAITLLGWSVFGVIRLGAFPTIANVLYYAIYRPGPAVLVFLFSSFVTSLWIANRLMHQYASIYPDSHTRPLDGRDT